jgi:galactokinase
MSDHITDSVNPAQAADQHPHDLSNAVLSAFKQQYSVAASHLSRAPGRVNIIGEHTDYNDGFVLPAAIQQAIFIAGRLRDDERVTIHSLDYHGVSSFTLDQLKDASLPSWTSYPRGVLWLLSQECEELRGVDLTIAGNVPLGAGFSSSAAVEVALLEMCTALFGIKLTQKEKAVRGQQVEHKFIGVRTGIMDQMISACGKADHALLLDCRSLDTQAIPIPAGVSLLACDTGKRRELVTSEYGKRREQCENAARLLGVKALRDVTPEMLAANAHTLPEVERKRATHVVNEDVRTMGVVAAFQRGDLPAAGALINAGHESLSKLYEVSVKELDIMAEIAQRTPGVIGARMMGGGFGGAVIALVHDDDVEAFSAAVAAEYQAATGLPATIYRTKAGAGSSVERV